MRALVLIAGIVGMLAAGVRGQGVIINELLANPTEAVGSEWVELVNLADTAVGLAGWQVGDALRQVVIADSGLIMPPGSFVVLVQDSAAFAAFYGGIESVIVEPTGWAIFNNGEDVVRLTRSDSMPADVFAYDQVFADDVTWSRDPDDFSRWERSREEGGTPGRANEVVPEWTGRELDIVVTPRVFSPDGDGVEDSVVIELRAPVDAAYALEIYDREGRKVWEEEVELMDLAPYYVWHGRTTGGARLPVGIYIIFLEAVNGVVKGESARETVVIAR